MPNEKLIREVINNIELYNRWDQRSWGELGENHFDEFGEVIQESLEPVPAYARDEYGNLVLTQELVREGSCNTSFCFAGHTVLTAGDKILINTESGEAWNCVDQNGVDHNIEIRARELLGLTREQAVQLFDGEAGERDFGAYKRLVTRVTGVTFEEEQANA